jgi:chorismate mutase
MPKYLKRDLSREDKLKTRRALFAELQQKRKEQEQVVQKIGEFKRDNGVTILQVNRWDHIMNKRSAFAKALKLDLNFTGKLLELIHSESIRKQTEIMNDKMNVE